jgi:hypothetical protein
VESAINTPVNRAITGVITGTFRVFNAKDAVDVERG